MERGESDASQTTSPAPTPADRAFPIADQSAVPGISLPPEQQAALKRRVHFGQATIVRGNVGSVDRVWAAMKAGFFVCIKRGLVKDPNQHGELRVVVDVGSKGEVVEARAEGGDGLTRETIDCALRRAKTATFLPPEPEGSLATLVLAVMLDPGDEPGPTPK